MNSIAIVLRFRDFGNEGLGTIVEHKKILRRYGCVWWGWWRRSAEKPPRRTLQMLFPNDKVQVPLLLFDAGSLQLYSACATRVIVAPTEVGINSPDFDMTPDYYVRGHFMLWFRLERDINSIDSKSLKIVGKPAAESQADFLPDRTSMGIDTELETLQNDKPTLWLAHMPGQIPITFSEGVAK